jgi:hypothetical protein
MLWVGDADLCTNCHHNTFQVLLVGCQRPCVLYHETGLANSSSLSSCDVKLPNRRRREARQVQFGGKWSKHPLCRNYHVNKLDEDPL